MVKVGHAFSDYVTHEKTGRRYSNNNFSSYSFSKFIPFLLIMLLAGVLVGRLLYIGVFQGAYYKKLSNQNRTRTTIIPAGRGVILDRKGRALVANSPAFKLIEEKDGKKNVIILGRDDALKQISRGIDVKNDVLRDYIYKSAFAHVLGYVGPISEDEVSRPEFSEYAVSDFVGKLGLEKSYERLLHGKNGKELFEVDSRGKMTRSLGNEPPQDGKNLNTTLDLDVGLSVAKAFLHIKKGAVVVSDPRDGGILAIYSKPTFDPNIFTHPDKYLAEGDYRAPENAITDSDNQPLLDRAISGTYPPGSTFKLITAIAALEDGSIRPDTQIEDTGILKIGAFSFGNWYFLQYGRREGSLDIIGAIKRSNDIFFYKAAEETGVDNVSFWAKTFGLGSKSGIDLPGEAHGTVPTVEWKKQTIGEQWYLGDTYNYGIGQGYLLTTPLQVNLWATVFANGGTIYRPHLLAGKKEVVEKSFIKGEYMGLVREGMRESCDTGGVAWPLFNFKVKNPNLIIDNNDYTEEASGGAKFVRVKLACKTGTAEIGGAETKPHAWITVFAPFSHPEIAVTVLVENGGEGSSIAGPVARDILKDYFERK